MPFQRLFSLSFSLLPHRREQQQQENASSSPSSSSPPPSRQSSLSADSTASFSSPFSDAEKRDYHHSRHDGHGESDEEWEMGTITARKARVLLPSSSIGGDRRAHRRRGSTAEKKRAGKDDEEEEEEEEEGKEQEAAKLWREWWI